MIDRRSIRFRLAAWYAGVLFVTFILVGVGVWFGVRHSIYVTVDRDLRARAQAMDDYLQQQLREAGRGGLAEELKENAALAPAGARFRVADQAGIWIFSSSATNGWNPSTPDRYALTPRGVTRTEWVNGRPIRILLAPIQAGVIEVGIGINEFYEMLADFTWMTALVSPALLLLASAGGYWMSRRALEPVARIAVLAEEISASSLSKRLPVRGTGDELDRMSVTLNRMFARLETAFEKVTRFTADASHELRTPAAIIRTTAELARYRVRSASEYEAALDQILAESERTTQLIDDLMLLARADGGVEGLISESMDLAAIVRDVCQQARVLAEAANVRFVYYVPLDCPTMGDERAIRRLVLALIDNAVKYTPANGHVWVEMKVDQIDGSRYATIQVSDSGIGIESEDLPRIFDRFYRASKDRSRATGGAGLGLSIAQWLASQSGGKIVAESTPGVGSVFQLQLPLIN